MIYYLKAGDDDERKKNAFFFSAVIDKRTEPSLNSRNYPLSPLPSPQKKTLKINCINLHTIKIPQQPMSENNRSKKKKKARKIITV